MYLGYIIYGELKVLSLGYTFHWWQGKDYFIKEFCIKTDEQNKGLGYTFLMEMESYLVDQGLKAIYLMTEKEIPAFNFYHKNGYKLLKDSVMFAKNIVDKK
jgi:aminoglycoside 6'-N-acetyltransferase I